MVPQVIPLHVFHRRRPGFVDHIAASRLLTHGEGRAYVVKDCLPIAVKHIGPFRDRGHWAHEPIQSAMNLTYTTHPPFLPFFTSESARRGRFSKVTQASGKQDIFDSRHILILFD
jgi:hypothetical protein